ncbi:ABC transporter permease [Spiroplasma sp. BIUS-1]|uniref:ABC transporter permease n=1 Tax=Spiroplasma sp. BIUS-1 TaxID=216964 RepID=UPI0013A6CF4F|nr:hypothetical protein [Spiroplasma sp. BIUS-1]
MSFLTFTININDNLDSVWKNGYFHNVEYAESKFSQENENLNGETWVFRDVNDQKNTTYIKKFILDNIKLKNIDDTLLNDFIEEVGKVRGDVNQIKNQNPYKDIIDAIKKSDSLNLKYYNFNLLNAFIVKTLYQDLENDVEIFPVKATDEIYDEINYQNYEFYVAPYYKQNSEKYLQYNQNDEFYIFDQISEKEVQKLDNNYIFLTPAALKKHNKKIGEEFIFYNGFKKYSTTIAGTAITKTTIPKKVDSDYIYAPYDYLLENDFMSSYNYGVYLHNYGRDFNESSIFFNKWLNRYIYNDDLDLYQGNYVKDPSKSPYYTIYKNPKFIFNLLVIFIVTIVISLVVITYGWIAIFSINKQKSLLWTLKANGSSNTQLGFGQIIGDLLPQLFSVLLSVPVSFLIYKIFLYVVNDQYNFDISNSYINIKAVIVCLSILIVIFSIYFFINFLIIKKEITIHNKKIHISKGFVFLKKLSKNKKAKLNLAIYYPNFSKSIITSFMLLFVYAITSFGFIFEYSLKESVREFEKYMLPYKSYSEQIIPQDTKEPKSKDEYTNLNIEQLKKYKETQEIDYLKEFIQYLETVNPLETKVSSEDVNWLSLNEFNNPLISEMLNKLKSNISKLNNQYDTKFYPEIYFKNFPKMEEESTFNIYLQNRVWYTIVGLEKNHEIFKEINVTGNEIYINEILEEEFLKWGQISNDILSLKINDKDIEFKVVGVTDKVVDDYYFFADKDYLINEIFGGENQKNNSFFTKNPYPIFSELFVIPTEKNGNKITDYYDFESKNLYDFSVRVMDYGILTERLIDNGKMFGNLTKYTSYIVMVLSVLIITILIALMIISNSETLLIMKQIGYKNNSIILTVLTGYQVGGLVTLTLNFALIGVISSFILNLITSVVGVKVLLFYSASSFIIPILIYLSFISITYLALAIYLKKMPNSIKSD